MLQLLPVIETFMTMRLEMFFLIIVCYIYPKEAMQHIVMPMVGTNLLI